MLRDFLISIAFGAAYTEYSNIIIPLVIWMILSITNNFLGIQFLVASGHQKEYMYMNIISILTYIGLECTDEKNSLFSDVDIVPEIVGIIEKDIKEETLQKTVSCRKTY